ncbi:MAG: nucleotide sugar dehydrogenase [Candidatus Eremiobacteraeota bacterium]|nr:nucleotide sugar dehydrogenase [Candidatus Eremiobacteraeota bacterium]
MALPRICILGLGYIGLPTAGMFAVNGMPVLGVDVNSAVVSQVAKGGVHIAEPGLRTVIQAAVGSGALRVSERPEPSDVFIIAVPTPLTAEKRADLSFVEEASSMIAPCLAKGNMVIVESTIPPRTTEKTVIPLIERPGLKAGVDFDVVHCPERVIPGKILLELVENDRVIGGITAEAARRAEALYRAFVRGKILLTDLVTAEMVKLVENSFRDVNVAFANELSRISAVLGINAREVISLANHHPRVRILDPGPGVGGHCIAVDPWFIAECVPNEARLIRAARAVNDGMPAFVVDRIIARVPEKAKVALWGLTYKADVDDLRESPSLEVARLLREGGFSAGLFDPYVRNAPEIEVATLEESVKDASLIVLLVGHRDFRFINPRVVAPLVREKRLLDVKQFLDRAEWEAAGFICH